MLLFNILNIAKNHLLNFPSISKTIADFFTQKNLPNKRTLSKTVFSKEKNSNLFTTKKACSLLYIVTFVNILPRYKDMQMWQKSLFDNLY